MASQVPHAGSPADTPALADRLAAARPKIQSGASTDLQLAEPEFPPHLRHRRDATSFDVCQTSFDVRANFNPVSEILPSNGV